MEISINAALAELKLLNKKINDKTEALFIASCYGNKTTKEETDAFEKKAGSDFDSLKALIENRAKMKSLIVLSNAMTSIKIGDKEMFVAEAIERKNSIELERVFCTRIRENYYNCLNQLEKHNKTIQAKGEERASIVLSGDDDEKTEVYKSVLEKYIADNGAKLFSIKDVEEKIEKMQATIDDFEKNVDIALTESNVKTLIVID